ncbi:hypothetical protein SAMN06265338_13511 [Rhodoblastus acidophilus]|uniref:Uncharacterized protein n=1 Tax=Rhodoblastus acidophilus TaxID=1074 RepID=A0A212SFP8_RHOAC|nr:hypothetical protein [Rhodoblastus acidophilus]MCW2319117.1 hypothetical protein [Rhodoblastus acidophilus]PPQ34919.1 hypothetical protein CKO16_21580 [Rhodoblastus acidophilus]RAI16628.1 hypothetical protein CH337_20405 [Rhodoblastus acidophilus]SNB84347.1 hypothetical protein SAMN06265338_13511 [Rhodoblastus acidophilus]
MSTAGLRPPRRPTPRKTNTIAPKGGGDETPEWIADKQKRLGKIREAKQAIEEEPAASAAAKAAAERAAEEMRQAEHC